MFPLLPLRLTVLLPINIPYKVSPPWEQEREIRELDTVELGEFVVAGYLASQKKCSM